MVFYTYVEYTTFDKAALHGGLYFHFQPLDVACSKHTIVPKSATIIWLR